MDDFNLPERAGNLSAAPCKYNTDSFCMNKQIAIAIIQTILRELEMNPTDLARAIGMSRTQGLYDVLNEKKENVGISKNIVKKLPRIYVIFTGKSSKKGREYFSKESLRHIANALFASKREGGHLPSPWSVCRDSNPGPAD